MKLLAAFAGSGVLVGGLYAGGVLGAGEVYDLPIDQVRAELVAMPVPAEALLGGGGSDTSGVIVSSEPYSVTWRLSSAEAATRFTAVLKPMPGGKTLVTLSSEAPGSGSGYGARLTNTRFLRGFVDSSFAEQVDAQLEGRAADQGRAMQDFARQAAQDPEQIRELGLAVGEMFNEVAEEASRGAFSTAGPVGADAQARMQAATRPTTVLPPNN